MLGRMESDIGQKPNSHSLLARVTAAGIADAVFGSLEAGQTLRAVAKLCTDRGVDASVAAVHDLKRRHLVHWSTKRISAEAEREGITERTTHETVRAILLARIGKLALDAHAVEDLRVVCPLFEGWTRGRVAELAEQRAERDSVRRLCLRIDDLLEDESKLAAVRKARDEAAGEGLEKRLLAIRQAMWPDLPMDEAA